MSKWIKYFWIVPVALCLFSGSLFAESQAVPAAGAPVDPTAAVTPYRTFITIQRYNLEASGDRNPISNVRLTIVFPNGNTLQLPEGGQYWPIGNGQAQEINRTFEIPWSYVANDGFKFVIKMEHKGNPLEPCNFDVTQLSQFNRAYTCHTDLLWQQNRNIPAEKLNKEGVQIRVFTSKNSLPNEIPKDALALK